MSKSCGEPQGVARCCFAALFPQLVPFVLGWGAQDTYFSYASILSVQLPSQAAVVCGGDGAGFGWPCGGSHPSTPSYNNHHGSSAVVVSSTDESYRCRHHHCAFANIT